MNVNPHNFKDGELCPCVGGPLDGQSVAVHVLFDFLDGGVPSRAYSHGALWYELDGANRRWVFMGLTAHWFLRGNEERTEANQRAKAQGDRSEETGYRSAGRIPS